MKKIISLLIGFIFIFNFIAPVFAFQTGTVDVGSFDEFSIEQVQKTFSSTLSQEQTSSNQDTEKQMLSLNEVLCNAQNNFFVRQNSLSNNLFFENKSYGLNYLYQYKLFEKNGCSSGISEYKINFNSYMATALFDIYGVVFYL
ncbi:MAG: hypothetical protein IKO48_04135 [Elusimicrobia bacterium]|nr:hypothetical protein [Elusimicrobiota bacterium]